MVGTPRALEHLRARSSTVCPPPLSWLTRYWDPCSRAPAVLVLNPSMCRPAWHDAVMHAADGCGDWGLGATVHRVEGLECSVLPKGGELAAACLLLTAP